MNSADPSRNCESSAPNEAATIASNAASAQKEAGHFDGSPDSQFAATIQTISLQLDRMCKQAHERSIDILVDEEEPAMRGGDSVRLDVYRSIRAFKRSEKRIRDQFVAAIEAHLNASSGSSELTTSPGRGLALMSEEDLEHEVLCTTLVSQVHGTTMARLHQLAATLQSRCGVAESTFIAIAGPRALLDVYLASLARIQLEPEVRIAVLKALHAQLVLGLETLYEHALQQYGVVPPIAAAFRNPVAPQGAGKEAAEEDPGSPAAPSHASAQPEARHGLPVQSLADPGAGNAMLSAVLQLLAGRNAAIQKSGSRSHWSREQVLRTLLMLQASSSREPARDLVDPVKEVSLAESLERALCETNALRTQDRALADADRAIADLVEMLFEFLMADPEFPDALRDDLLKLRVPFLRLALLDRKLLLRKDSAARQLLERLVQSAIELGTHGSKAQEVRHLFRTTVKQVLHNFEDDVRELALALGNFSAAVEQLRKRGNQSERRVVDLAESRERMLSCWQLIATTMRKATGDTQLPPFVRDLLHRPWAQYLVLLRLRNQHDGPEWRSALSAAAGLIDAFADWSTLPSREPDRAQHAMKLMASVAIDLRTGLQSVGYSTHEVVQVWRGLMRLLTTGCSAADPATEIAPTGHDIASALRDYGGGPDNEVALAQLAPQDVNSTEAPATLQIGQWLEYTSSTKESAQRIKLCWRGRASGLHVFVNRAGVKVLELANTEVSRMLAGGELRTLAEGPAVERALLGILSKLDPQAVRET